LDGVVYVRVNPEKERLTHVSIGRRRARVAATRRGSSV
jgi:hypothetical protein